VTFLLQRRLLRGVSRNRQRDERKHQQDHPHLGLQRFPRSPERGCGRFMPRPRHREREGRHTATRIPLAARPRRDRRSRQSSTGRS
jgi:hypothetical protein